MESRLRGACSGLLCRAPPDEEEGEDVEEVKELEEWEEEPCVAAEREEVEVGGLCQSIPEMDRPSRLAAYRRESSFPRDSLPAAVWIMASETTCVIDWDGASKGRLITRRAPPRGLEEAVQ